MAPLTLPSVARSMSYYPACNRICNCTSAASPVCSPHDEISFISPCYAGCTGFSNITGQNVSVERTRTGGCGTSIRASISATKH